jgi:hypothetical protein
MTVNSAAILVPALFSFWMQSGLLGHEEKTDCPAEIDEASNRCKQDVRCPDRAFTRPADLGFGGDISCLRCQKTWVACELSDNDVRQIQKVIKTRDKRPILSITAACEARKKRKQDAGDLFRVATGISCAPLSGNGNFYIVKKTAKGAWRILSREGWDS